MTTETAGEKILRYQRALDCVHCGLCLPVCPTYKLTGKESASPRGRIYLMRAFAEGRLPEEAGTIGEIDGCLVCRACETVCPSGVQFGEMMELTRDLLEPTKARASLPRTLKRAFFRFVLAKPARVRRLATALRLYRESGLRFLLRKLGVLHLFGRGVVRRDDLLPQIPPLSERSEPPPLTKARGERRARVGFLVGCIAHELLPKANRAAIEVLAQNGCDVVCPPSRPCCGALPMHFGDLEAARRLARATLDAFPPDLDAIVVSSAGCASSMKEYHRLLEHDATCAERAKAFSAKVKDWNEFLVALPFIPPGARLDLRVAYSEPCHLVHAQRISAAPKRLLQSIPGVELVPFEGQDSCCGAAGLYSVTQPEQSVALLEEKMARLAVARPDVIVTANPGCHLQLKSGAAGHLPEVEVLHVAELLERAYRGTDPAASPDATRGGNSSPTAADGARSGAGR
jgi:glycolate dehydrogenase iron-sulfur subunit